ncbi:hypothetical protein [Chryseobacterium sp. MP_3.2]|uniref:hypothetical protein n=1 Tax=Chryseobacterium sp. MP_3.2 TaxID=3071712 RepID=UPI002DFEE3E0|nr:hypothetical protein [Chryseobacterium sp. MP_3.2]
MKRFLIKTAFWMVPLIGLQLILGAFADGNTDDNYRHFTSQATSFIMGDSRGSQAIVPSVLNEKIKHQKFDNFSLNISHSPYGPLYLEAVKKKIKPDTKEAVFILTVGPWNLSAPKNVSAMKDLPENEISPLKNMNFYNLNPNYEYLIKNFNHSWFQLFRDRESQGKSNTYLHEDGWLEVTVDMKESVLRKRTAEKVEFYKLFAKDQAISPLRLQSFEKTIDFLKTKGQVYVVRIPASKEIMKIENQYRPNFNQVMQDITRRKNIPYFDFTGKFNAYQYTDGNHMYKESSKIFTAEIADSINAYKAKLK